MYEVATIPFKDTPGFLSIRDAQTGTIYIVPRDICDLFGIDRKSQQRKLARNSGRWGYRTIWVQLPGDDRKRSTAVIPDTKVRTWICSINPEKVKAEIQERLIAFQQECDQVLYDYWTKGVAFNPRSSFDITPEFQNFIGEIVRVSIKEAIREFGQAISATFFDRHTFAQFAQSCDERIKALEKNEKHRRPKSKDPLQEINKIDLEQAQSLRDLVREKGRSRKGICRIWKEFRQKFALARYSDLPEKNFHDAMRWLNTM